jgi:hypothetical protein
VFVFGHISKCFQSSTTTQKQETNEEPIREPNGSKWRHYSQTKGLQHPTQNEEEN